MITIAELLDHKKILLSDQDRHKWRCKIGAESGRAMEIRVEQILRAARDLQGNPVFYRVVRHEPFSVEDSMGHDLTVSMYIDDKLQELSFGISVSKDRIKDCCRKHENQFLWLLPSFSDQMIIERVVELFRPELRIIRTINKAVYQNGNLQGQYIFAGVRIEPSDNSYEEGIHFVVSKWCGEGRFEERSFIVYFIRNFRAKKRIKTYGQSIFYVELAASAREIISVVDELFIASA